MNRRSTALLLASTLVFCGCAAGHSARFSTSATQSFAYADSYEGVQQHFDRLLAELRQIEELERRKQPGRSQSSRSIRHLRPFYVAYRRSVLSKGAGAHGRNYLRLQHEILDAFSAQLVQLKRLLAKLPNDPHA